jgi:hypothetical protein
MDWVHGQIEARRLEAAKRRELVRDIRQVMRTGDVTSEWVADAKGVSRDGPA